MELPSIEQINILFDNFDEINQKLVIARKVLKIKEAALLQIKQKAISISKPEKVNDTIELLTTVEKKEYDDAKEALDKLEEEWRKLGLIADRYRMLQDAQKIALRIG